MPFAARCCKALAWRSVHTINVGGVAYVPKEKKHMARGIINLAAETIGRVWDRDGDDVLDRARAVSSIATESASTISARRITKHVNGMQVKLVRGSTRRIASAASARHDFGTIPSGSGDAGLYFDNVKMLA